MKTWTHPAQKEAMAFLRLHFINYDFIKKQCAGSLLKYYRKTFA